MKNKAVGFYDYTVILTYAGMLFSFFGIMRVIEQDYHMAVLCLLAAGICDMFDGTIAGTKDRDIDEKRFGVQIDSLSDLISVGVFPALFSYMIAGRHIAAAWISALFALSALIRLAYFNVLSEKHRTSVNPEVSDGFIGLPVTTIAILLPVVYLLYDEQRIRSTFSFSITRFIKMRI